MNNMSEYDERHLKFMQEDLIAFEKKQIPLCGLVNSLECLLSALESVDRGWSYNFTEEIATLETINAVEMIKKYEKDILDDEPELDEDTKEKVVNKAICNLKKIIESELRQVTIERRKKIDELHMRNLSFLEFKVEKMECSFKEKTLKFFMEGAWLEEEGGKLLGKGFVFFSNWESLTISVFNADTGCWSLLENIYPEYLKDIREFKFIDPIVRLCGFSEKTGQWMEWKLINTKMYAEFEPDSF